MYERTNEIRKKIEKEKQLEKLKEEIEKRNPLGSPFAANI